MSILPHRHQASPVLAPVDILALTLWAEAGTRSVRAIEALAAVVMNRVRRAEQGEAARWGRGVAGVCRAPFQYSCWNPRHPRHLLMMAAPAGAPALAMCRRIAVRAMAGLLSDPTSGATHHHGEEELPAWAVARTPCAELGGFLFYKAEAVTQN
ncbi:cell wall hydrolase [Roseomonas marmotae]|uniref:Cell wall hydrolase n=1 Tax=Roseomonas marmotae TaxID=2768161 RepID=A0ABS3KE87_9PROT|nr:cell wall hydrolase [Roseomonas marmotae]MBO1075760.1 cell wall hydrolase [Roseomonas marmotae]QTI80488.1 cell wall hydrolase [Roseomonas marmotae]